MNASAANFTMVVTTWTDSHVLHAGQVDRRRNPQPDQHQQHRDPLGVAGVDEVLGIQHPADRDRGVARPGGDPVRPGVREPPAVAEGGPGA
jgi:hypothetical protein